MLTIKTGRKQQRRAAQVFAEGQLVKIQQTLQGYQAENETPQMAVKRLMQELKLLKGDAEKASAVEQGH